MLREQHGKEDESRQSGKNEQEGIQHPEVLLPFPFENAECDDDDRQRDEYQGRGDDFCFCHFLGRRYQIAGGIHQHEVSVFSDEVVHLCIARRVVDEVFSSFGGEVFAQIIWQELPFALGEVSV